MDVQILRERAQDEDLQREEVREILAAVSAAEKGKSRKSAVRDREVASEGHLARVQDRQEVLEGDREDLSAPGHAAVGREASGLA